MAPDWKPQKRIRDSLLLRRFRLAHAGEPCEICEREIGTEIHHRVFRSQGGGDVEENLLWLGPRCHRDLHDGRISRYDLP